MMIDAVAATVDPADQYPDGLGKCRAQAVARMVKHSPIQRHVAFERMRPQAVGEENLVHLPATGGMIVDFPESAVGWGRLDDLDPCHSRRLAWRVRWLE